MTKTRIIVAGAAGRMGQRLIAMTLENPDAEFVGAVEAPRTPAIGKDAAEIAGCGAKNIMIHDCLEKIINKNDVVISFATPEASMQHLEIVTSQGKGIVIGTTGFNEKHKDQMKAYAKKIPVVFAPNMSVGVNVMWKLVEEAAKVFGDHFNVSVSETHHTKKKDAPSGTAVKIGEILAKALNKKYEEIPIESIREGDVIGDHTTLFKSPEETLEITHHAINRDIFAKGSVQAAIWVKNQKPGLYDMQDVLGLINI